jgi:serine/threonine-protein kinase
MKPENVFLQRTEDGEEIVKIVDFGIAQLRTNDEVAASEPKRRRLTKTGMIFGTPEYMAPEQAGGRRADHRADVYAVGVILYEMFTGAVPFTGDSFVAVLTRTLQDPPPPMHEVAPDIAISGELQAAILCALGKTPEERPASMGELAHALLATPEGTRLKGTLAGTDVFARQSQMPQTTPQFVPQPEAPMGPAPPDRATGGTMLTSPGAGAVTLGARTASTQLVSAHTAAPRSTGSLGLVVSALVVLLLVAGGTGAWWVLRGAATAAAPEVPSAAPPASPRPSVAPPPSATAAPSAEVSAITTVTIRVETQPAGALVLKDGFQVCDDTPCSVTAAPNETLELEATKGPLRGKQKVLAQRDQTVQITLAAPVIRPKAPAANRLCEVEVDGLKILRPCN